MKRILINTKGRLRNAWWVVVFFILLAAMLFPLILIAEAYTFEITFWHQVALIALTSLICQRLSGNPVTKLFGSTNRFWPDILIGFCLGGLLMLVPALILTVLGMVHWEIAGADTGKIWSAVWLMTGVVLAEELLFRGFIFQRLISGFGEWPAQIIVALLFLLTHSANLGISGPTKIFAIINIFTASLLFGMAYLRTGSLIMPIAIHFSANVMQGSILGFSVSGNEEVSILKPVVMSGNEFLTGGHFGIEASLFGLLTLLILTVTFYIRNTKMNS